MERLLRSDVRNVAPADEYLTLADLKNYSKISVRQLKRFLSRETNPLPHVRNGRRPLILRSAFDAWIASGGAKIGAARAAADATANPLVGTRLWTRRVRSLREITADLRAELRAAGRGRA
jgi:hypothetical protein